MESTLTRGLGHLPDGLEAEKDATALLARRHGSWSVALGVWLKVVMFLVESSPAVEELVPLDGSNAEEGRAVEHATKTKGNTETLLESLMMCW